MMMVGPLHSSAPCGHECPKQTQNCEDANKCISRCAAYGNVCPFSARSAGRAAHTKMESILRDSKVFQGKPQFRTIEPSEIRMGEKLGEGGFSQVDACSLKEAPLDESCAIKYLKRRVMVDEKNFQHGAADLATEAFFLARLDHPNIISLHAVTAGNVELNVSCGTDASFFIVVDRLVETLENRINRWRSQAEDVPSSLFYRLSKEYKATQKSMLVERLRTALQIAVVMEYLHSLGIVFRDLKPDNIGFDREGTLKLFDFGLAKEEKPAKANEDGTYNMTGHTGSRRYMAPEVATDKPYNKSVDIFSFGILLWEMCSFEKPFQGYSTKKHMKDVVIGGERPKMDSSHTAHWPVSLQWLMKSCWSTDPMARPNFAAVISSLNELLEELSVPNPERSRARSMGHHVDTNTETCTSHIKKPTKRFGMGLIRSRT